MMRVLIVDNETFLLQGLGMALQSDATEVKAVETGSAALREVAAASYDLCFLDIYLPDINGLEVLKSIKEASPRTKVVMMTAGVVTAAMQASIEKSADMFLTKPFDLLQVRMLMKSALGESRDTAA